MSFQKLITGYSAYNAWANGRLTGWLANMDKELLYKEVPSSFSSIDLTVQHIWRVQRYWLDFVCEKDMTDFDWSVHENQAGRMLAKLDEQSRRMQEVISAFSEAELNVTLHLETPWAKNDLSRYEYIMHCMNHSTYHRGQIITMARVLGITEGIPSTEYNLYNSR